MFKTVDSILASVQRKVDQLGDVARGACAVQTSTVTFVTTAGDER